MPRAAECSASDEQRKSPEPTPPWHGDQRGNRAPSSALRGYRDVLLLCDIPSHPHEQDRCGDQEDEQGQRHHGGQSHVSVGSRKSIPHAMRTGIHPRSTPTRPYPLPHSPKRQYPRHPSRRRPRRWLSRQPQVRETPMNLHRITHQAEHSTPRSARAREHIDQERSPQQLGPDVPLRSGTPLGLRTRRASVLAHGGGHARLAVPRHDLVPPAGRCRQHPVIRQHMAPRRGLLSGALPLPWPANLNSRLWLAQDMGWGCLFVLRKNWRTLLTFCFLCLQISPGLGKRIPYFRQLFITFF